MDYEALIKLVESGKKNILSNTFYEEFTRELENESERGIVLLCCSIIEELLKIRLLEFVIDDEKAVKDLFKTNGAFSNAESRVQSCFYLGLIPKSIKENILTLQKIRNKFGHQVTGISLDSEQVKGLCNNLYIPKDSYLPPIIISKDIENSEFRINLNPIDKTSVNKDKFIFTFQYVYSYFTATQITKEKRTLLEESTVLNRFEEIQKNIKNVLQLYPESSEILSNELGTIEKEQCNTVNTLETISEFNSKLIDKIKGN